MFVKKFIDIGIQMYNIIYLLPNVGKSLALSMLYVPSVLDL